MTSPQRPFCCVAVAVVADDGGDSCTCDPNYDSAAEGVVSVAGEAGMAPELAVEAAVTTEPLSLSVFLSIYIYIHISFSLALSLSLSFPVFRSVLPGYSPRFEDDHPVAAGA